MEVGWSTACLQSTRGRLCCLCQWVCSSMGAGHLFWWDQWSAQWTGASTEAIESHNGKLQLKQLNVTVEKYPFYIKYCTILKFWWFKYLKKWYTTWTHHVICFLKCTWFVYWRSVHIFPYYIYMYDIKGIWYIYIIYIDVRPRLFWLNWTLSLSLSLSVYILYFPCVHVNLFFSTL